MKVLFPIGIFLNKALLLNIRLNFRRTGTDNYRFVRELVSSNFILFVRVTEKNMFRKRITSLPAIIYIITLYIEMSDESDVDVERFEEASVSLFEDSVRDRFYSK